MIEGTLMKVIKKRHRSCNMLHPAAPFTFVHDLWLDQKKHLEYGEVLVFCTETFFHKGQECLLSVTLADDRIHPVLGCVGLDMPIGPNVKLMFNSFAL
jgi:hypothetical protein